jgi:hypothetical protein
MRHFKMTPLIMEKITFTARTSRNVYYILPNLSKDWLIGFIEAV